MLQVHAIHPLMLEEAFLTEHLYPDLERTLYWTMSWDPGFYVDLAMAGFISIAHLDPQLGPVLIPELQRSYAFLEWERLHCSRNLRRLLRSKRLTDEGVELRIEDSVDRVLERLTEHHEQTWILAPYAELMRTLSLGEDPRIAVHGVELWSRKRNALVAGEIGYSIGRTYTSLSGFCSPDEPALRHFGTLQMVLLAGMLRERGYAFWNMGHPTQVYKRAIGAVILPRVEFLSRWRDARHGAPVDRLGGSSKLAASRSS